MQPNIGRDRALIALLIVGAALNFGAVHVAAGRKFTVPPPTPLPLTFEGYKGADVPTEDSTKAILPHARITTINYEKEGAPMVQLVVTASRDPNDMHTPERCFTGSGAAISERETLPLDVPGPDAERVSLNKMVSTDSSGQLLVLYCYDNVPAAGTTWATRIVMKIKPMDTPAYFVRFSTPITGDIPTTQKNLLAFAAKYMEGRRVWEALPASK
jgi:hypothetical protein